MAVTNLTELDALVARVKVARITSYNVCYTKLLRNIAIMFVLFLAKLRASRFGL